MPVDFNALLQMQEQDLFLNPEDLPTDRWIPRSQKTGAASEKQAPPLILLSEWSEDIDTAGWWLSEKYDGCRAYWDGEKFLSRQGNTFPAPAWFTGSLGDSPLDGELWLDYGRFSECVSICKGGSDADWAGMSYRVFDAPGPEIYEHRFKRVLEICEHTQPWIRPVIQTRTNKCSKEYLEKRLNAVMEDGGEGLVVRDPTGLYIPGRSNQVLKILKARTSEATVIGYNKGVGSRDGGVGSLRCKLSNGIEFNIGTGLKMKDVTNPPPIGSVVTFEYKCLTQAGIPREPRFIRVKTDSGL
jgi:DNA ligase 1